MNKFIRFLALILTLVVMFTCVACKKNNNKDDNTDTNNPGTTTDEVQTPTVVKMNYTGLHQYDYTEREGEYLVQNGTTEYTLVFPASSDYLGLRSVARREFSYFFKMATDISIPSTSDAGLEHNETNKYISLGETALLHSAVEQGKIDRTNDMDELNAQGARIVTIDDTIFIYGPTEWSNLYGVYTFMETEFNFMFYYTTAYDIDTGVSTITMKDYDVKDAPDLRYRCPNFYYSSFATVGPSDDEAYDHYRTRKNYSFNKWFLNIHQKWDDPNSTGANNHTAMDFIADDGVREEHPDWFSTQQPCYTAHGNPEEYELMIQHHVKKIQNCLKMYPVATNPMISGINMTIEDGGGHCGCDTCNKVAELFTTNERGGAPAGSTNAASMIFMNEVAKRMEYWVNYTPEDGAPLDWWDDWGGGIYADGDEAKYCQPEWKREGLYYVVFAYGDYNDCAANYNAELDCWEPIVLSAEQTPDELNYLTRDINATPGTAEDVFTGQLNSTIRHDVGVWYCHVKNGSSSFYKEPSDPTAINSARDKMRMWGDMTDNIWCWGYCANYQNHMVYNEAVASFSSEIYQAMQAAGVIGWFNNATSNTGSSTAFYLLVAFLDNVLSWNATLDTQEITMKYFKAMYQDGWQEMYQFFEDVRIHAKEGPSLDSNFSIAKEAAYTQPLVDTWLQLCEKARQKNEKYKEVDPELYEKTINHINIEWVMPAYMVLEWYPDSYSDEYIADMKKVFKETVIYNKISHLSEHSGTALLTYVENF